MKNEKNEIITGFGKPQTQEIKFHSSDIIPFLRLADSKGIEKNITSGVSAVYESIKQFIANKLATKDPDQYIHCIWYCWTGSRLEPSEIEILQKLSKQYQSEVLPVIIVYTNAVYPGDTREAINYIKLIFSFFLIIFNLFFEFLFSIIKLLIHFILSVESPLFNFKQNSSKDLK